MIPVNNSCKHIVFRELFHSVPSHAARFKMHIHIDSMLYPIIFLVCVQNYLEFGQHCLLPGRAVEEPQQHLRMGAQRPLVCGIYLSNIFLDTDRDSTYILELIS